VQKPEDYDRLMGLMTRGAAAQATQEAVAPHLREMNQAVDRRALALADRDALTPALAQQLWFEKLAVVRLQRQLAGVVKTGESAGRRLTEAGAGRLNEGSEDGHGEG